MEEKGMRREREKAKWGDIEDFAKRSLSRSMSSAKYASRAVYISSLVEVYLCCGKVTWRGISVGQKSVADGNERSVVVGDGGFKSYHFVDHLYIHVLYSYIVSQSTNHIAKYIALDRLCLIISLSKRLESTVGSRLAATSSG